MKFYLTIFTALFIPSILIGQSDSLNIYETNRDYNLPSETLPSFPEGPDSLRNFIEYHQANFISQEVKKGTVYLEFIVEGDGSISNIKVLKGINISYNNEAIRIMKLMPNWVPVTYMGQPRKVKMVLPIIFDK
jgi:protein TonB